MAKESHADAKPSALKSLGADAAVSMLKGNDAPMVAVDGRSLSLTYASIDALNKRVSADVESMRAAFGIVSSEQNDNKQNPVVTIVTG